ncbi:MAG: hypothetical protein AAF651_08410 [Cyanobacteria bacterium P01_C01_bin.73]
MPVPSRDRRWRKAYYGRTYNAGQGHHQVKSNVCDRESREISGKTA